MSSKSLSLSFARNLLRLSNGEQLNSSEIGSVHLLNRFCEDGIIQKRPLGNRRVSYSCTNPVALQNYLKVQNDIISLENYILAFEADVSDGENSLGASKSTKTFRRKSLQGFFIKAFDTKMSISGEMIPSTPNGIELFIHQPDKLLISDTALVVGIENPECFLKFEQLYALFPQKEIIAIMRYMSNSPNKWLHSITNHYMHFGDFDPAGLSIYIQEYHQHLGGDRCSFFVPQNMEELLSEYGIASLYDQQIHLLKNVDFKLYPEIKCLFEWMKKHRKGMEQERLLTLTAMY